MFNAKWIQLNTNSIHTPCKLTKNSIQNQYGWTQAIIMISLQAHPTVTEVTPVLTSASVAEIGEMCRVASARQHEWSIGTQRLHLTHDRHCIYLSICRTSTIIHAAIYTTNTGITYGFKYSLHLRPARATGLRELSCAQHPSVFNLPWQILW